MSNPEQPELLEGQRSDVPASESAETGGTILQDIRGIRMAIAVLVAAGAIALLTPSSRARADETPHHDAGFVSMRAGGGGASNPGYGYADFGIGYLRVNKNLAFHSGLDLRYGGKNYQGAGGSVGFMVGNADSDFGLGLEGGLIAMHADETVSMGMKTGIMTQIAAWGARILIGLGLNSTVASDTPSARGLANGGYGYIGVALSTDSPSQEPKK